jgi:hypothetical protein
VDTLCACLLTVPPLELKGMALLRQCHPTAGFFPSDVPRSALIDAIVEITAYTARSQHAAEALRNLAPVPLRSISVVEYGL